MYKTLMEKDSAQWICNSLYSVMIGFVLSATLFRNETNKVSIEISLLAIIVLLYYLIDWLSYNAILDYDKTQEHLEVFFTIVFVIMLGWILVLANYIELNKTPEKENIKNIMNYFNLGSILYILFTTVLSTFNIYKAYKKKETSAEFKTFAKEFIIGFIDLTVRLLVVCFFIVYYFEDVEKKFERLRIIFLIGYSLILLTKFIRYQFLLLPWVRAKEINCPIIEKNICPKIVKEEE